MEKYEDIEFLRKAVKEDVGFSTWTISTPHLMRFAELVRQDEREACAQVALDYDLHSISAKVIAATIKERGEKK